LKVLDRVPEFQSPLKGVHGVAVLVQPRYLVEGQIGA